MKLRNCIEMKKKTAEVSVLGKFKFGGEKEQHQNLIVTLNN
jgi:hypothetical protein